MHKRAADPLGPLTVERGQTVPTTQSSSSSSSSGSTAKRIRPSSPSLPPSSLASLPPPPSTSSHRPSSSSSSADKPASLRLSAAPQSAQALLVTPSGHAVPLLKSAVVSIGAKEGLCQLVLSGCSDISNKQCSVQWSGAHDCWQLQVCGRTGVNVGGQHVFPSSMPRDLPGTCAFLLCCSNTAHCHLYQLCLPANRSRPRGRVDDDFQNRSSPEWSDAEQLRFQRSIQAYGLHGLERVKTAATLNKKNRDQILNYAVAFLLECRKFLEDDSERLYVDTVMEKEGWQLRHTEPTLSKWKKLQANASVWVRRLRTIQLLEDIVIRSRADDVDVLSLLPKSSLRLTEGVVPAPWWNNGHDRALLLGVYEHGYCKYEDLKADRRFRFLIGKQWISKMQQWEQAQIDSKTGKAKKAKKKRVDEDEDDMGGDDDDEDERMDEDDSGGGGGGGGEDSKREAGAAKSEEDMIDVNDNSYGILFPPADLLTKRMRRLVENQRKLWWKKRDPLDYQDRPIRLKRTLHSTDADKPPTANDSDEKADKLLTRQQRLIELANTPWTESAVQRLLDAVLMYGVEKDPFGRIRWEKLLTHCQLPATSAADAERVLLHMLEDYFIGINAPSLSMLTVFSLPVISHRPLIPVADGTELAARLLFFSKLRTRLLPLSQYTLSSLLDTHRPETPTDVPLPNWYQPSAHDVCLMRGVGKWGVGAWQQLVDDETLGWQGQTVRPVGSPDESKSAVDDAADEEIQAINNTTAASTTATTAQKQAAPQQSSRSPVAEAGQQPSSRPLLSMHDASLWQRVQELVDCLYPLAPINAPLSTTFSALCPLIHAESSKDRRKREAAMREAVESGLRKSAKKQKQTSKAAVSVYSITESEMPQSFYYFVPSLTRYQRYMVARRLPLTDTVSPFDVTPLSITAVSSSHPVWKPLVRHRKVSSALVGAAGIDPNAAGAPPTLYICGDMRDEVSQLSPQHAVYRLYLSAATKQLVMPMWQLGGLTVYSLGRLDARCQCVDDRDQQSVYLCPIGYTAVRVHQSAVDPNKMARYLCEVTEEEGADEDVTDRWEQLKQHSGDGQVKKEEESKSMDDGPPIPLPAGVLSRRRVMFRVTSSDSPNTPLVSYSPHSAFQVLAGLLYDVANSSLISRRNDAPGGWERFGLTHPLVRYCIEGLEGVEQCVGYTRQGPIMVQRYEISDEPQQPQTHANDLHIRVNAP